MFKEEIMSILLKFIKKKVEEDGTMPNTFYKASFTLILKVDKGIIRNYRQIYLINIDVKILNKILGN